MKDELASLRQYLPARDERFSDSQPISMEANKADTPIRLTVDAFPFPRADREDLPSTILGGD